MKDHEAKINELTKINKNYLKEFKKWLKQKKLSPKTIDKHIDNTNLFINDYLVYYELVEAKDGINDVIDFLDGWFIEKCSWSTRNSLKEQASSLKKFYQYMVENNYVEKQAYEYIFNLLKQRMEDILDHVDEYNYSCFEDDDDDYFW